MSQSQKPPTPPHPRSFGVGARLSAVLTPDGVVRQIFDVAGIEGWDPASAIGRSMPEIAEASTLGRGDVMRARLAAALASEGALTFMDRRPGDIDARPLIETVITPILGTDAVPAVLLLQVSDREGRWEAERRAQASEEQLRNAVELTGLGMYTLYFREPRMDTNERFREIWQIDPQAVFETENLDGFFDLMHTDDAPKVRAALEAAMTTDVDYVASFRLWVPGPDGRRELRWIDALGRVEKDDDGPVRVLGVIEDVTDRRLQDEARLRSQKREAIGTLAGGVAHDFNNVLSAILSNASVAEQEIAAGVSPATSVREIVRGARRAEEVVKRLLAFSREQEIHHVPFDLAEVIAEACALLEPTLRAGVTVRRDTEPDLPAAFGDSTQLHQLVINLISNAAHVTCPGGTIVVRLDRAPDVVLQDGAMAATRLRLRVHDDGPRIPAAVASQMFDPFFTTKPTGEGTGLGLSAVQTIVRDHDGTIDFASAPGEGTTFTVTLPAALQPAERPDGAVPPRAEPSEEPGRTPRVLFVDDDAALTTLARRAMAVSGCEAIAFTDPLLALDAFLGAPTTFDAVITDLSMPGLTGLELAARIRASGSDVPIVLHSGFVTAGARVEADQIGVDRILPKPVPLDELSTTVVELLAERRRPPGATRGLAS